MAARSSPYGGGPSAPFRIPVGVGERDSTARSPARLIRLRTAPLRIRCAPAVLIGCTGAGRQSQEIVDQLQPAPRTKSREASFRETKLDEIAHGARSNVTKKSLMRGEALLIVLLPHECSLGDDVQLEVEGT